MVRHHHPGPEPVEAPFPLSQKDCFHRQLCDPAMVEPPWAERVAFQCMVEEPKGFAWGQVRAGGTACPTPARQRTGQTPSQEQTHVPRVPVREAPLIVDHCLRESASNLQGLSLNHSTGTQRQALPNGVRVTTFLYPSETVPASEVSPGLQARMPPPTSTSLGPLLDSAPRDFA